MDNVSFVGKWKLETRDPNFDKFLSCRRVSWFLRTVMTTFSADVEYSVGDNRDVLTKKTISRFGTKLYPMPYPAGDFTPERTLSGKPEHGTIKVREDGSGFTQKMYFSENGEEAALIDKRVNKEDKLIVTLSCKDIKCVEVYKRDSSSL